MENTKKRTISLKEIFFYLTIFSLPFLDVPYWENIFYLKPANFFGLIALILYFRSLKFSVPLLKPLLIFFFLSCFSLIQTFRLDLQKNLVGVSGLKIPPFNSLSWLGWFIFGILIFVLVSSFSKNEKNLKQALKIYLFSATLVSLYACILFSKGLIQGFDFINLRVKATASEPLFFANYLISILPLTVSFLFYKDIKSKWKRILFPLFFIQFFALFSTLSTGGLISFLISFLIILGINFRYICWKRLGITLSGIIFTIFIFFFFKPEIISPHFAKLYNFFTPISSLGEKEEIEILSVSGISSPLNCGKYYEAKVILKNISTTEINSEKQPIYLSYRWLDQEGKYLDTLRIRNRIIPPVKPQETKEIEVIFSTPDKPGKYILQWDLILEGEGFYQDLGKSRPFSQEIETILPCFEYKAEITPLNDFILKQGTTVYIPIKLKNTGNLKFESCTKYPVHLSYRWKNEEGNYLPLEGVRTELPKDILPGEEIVINGKVYVPLDLPPNVNLEFALVKEYVCWFPETKETKNQTNVPLYWQEEFTSVERKLLWQAGLNMFKDHPILGVGVANFGFLYNQYRPLGAKYRSDISVVNNLYLEILVETGILGFCGLILVIISILKLFLKMIKTKDNFKRCFIVGIFASLIAFAIQANTFSGFPLHLWVILGFFVSLKDEK